MQISHDILKRSWFLAGPTACGKSAAAVALAMRIGADILSMDSMSIYRGMEIGWRKHLRALLAADGAAKPKPTSAGGDLVSGAASA